MVSVSNVLDLYLSTFIKSPTFFRISYIYYCWMKILPAYGRNEQHCNIIEVFAKFKHQPYLIPSLNKSSSYMIIQSDI